QHQSAHRRALPVTVRRWRVDNSIIRMRFPLAGAKPPSGGFFAPRVGRFLMPTAEVGSLERESLYKAAIAAVGTAATYLWGGFDAVFKALIVLACMDYVTGWAAAWVHGRLSGDAGRRGIARK